MQDFYMFSATLITVMMCHELAIDIRRLAAPPALMTHSNWPTYPSSDVAFVVSLPVSVLTDGFPTALLDIGFLE